MEAEKNLERGSRATSLKEYLGIDIAWDYVKSR
jgi:hypothetical protein